MSDEIRYLGDVHRISLKEGDVVVITVPSQTSLEDRKQILDILCKSFVGHQVLVLDKECELSVVEAENE